MFLDEQSHVTIDHAEFLHLCENKEKIDRLESVEIEKIMKTNPHKLINQQLELIGGTACCSCVDLEKGR